MKSVFITFDQAFYERILALLDRQNCRGFSYWQQLQGRGSVKGEPHYGKGIHNNLYRHRNVHLYAHFLLCHFFDAFSFLILRNNGFNREPRKRFSVFIFISEVSGYVKKIYISS